MTLYYNTQTDQLGLAEPNWDYICLVKFVPFLRYHVTSPLAADTAEEPIGYIEHPIAEERTPDWVEVGVL